MCDLKNIDNVALPRNEVGNWSRSYRKVDTPYIPMHFKVLCFVTRHLVGHVTVHGAVKTYTVSRP